MVSYKVFRPGTLVAVIGAALAAPPAIADGWVFEPVIGLDQRFDDNFSLVPIGEDSVSATRLIGDLNISRIGPTNRIDGIIRGDYRIELGDTDDSVPEFNGLILVNSLSTFKRSRLSTDIRLTRDTPSDDIVSDVTDANDVAIDSGVVTQNFDVERLTFKVAPSFSYDLSRRSSLEGTLSFTSVNHDTPSTQDTLFAQYLRLLTTGGDNPPTPESNPELFDENGDQFTRDTVTTEQTGVFTPSDELDDYTDSSIRLGYRFKLNRISSVSLTGGYSRFVAQEEADASALVFEDLEPAGDGSIRRAPRRDSIDTTTSLTVGYNRTLDPTLNVALQIGVFNNRSDDTERFRRNDGTLVEGAELTTDEDGFLASIAVEKDAGRTQYSASFSTDVQPSSAGSRVETQELIGTVLHTLTPLIDISFRGQAYEPDRLGAQSEDRFARRFISFEPRIVYRFTRNWTFGAAYRYRRQKARIDEQSSESNALLFSIRFDPPSKLADADLASSS